MPYYDVFTTYTVPWQYIYPLPTIFKNNTFWEYQIVKISKWNKNLDFQIVRQFDWDIIKLMDTPKRKFKIKLFVIQCQ
jgi:hypothetical protein